MSFKPPIGDASTTKKGIVQLAGDISGTAASPTIPSLSTKLNISSRGAANGVASLDSGTKIPNAQIPVLSLSTLPPGSRLVCPWNSTTSKWTYDGVDLNTRPSNRTDIFFVYTGAPAATADPLYAAVGDKREDI